MSVSPLREKRMTLASSITLLLALIVLALIPGPGVLAVTSRAAAEGLKHGLILTVGIVAGDFIFITFALLGLSALSGVMGNMFIVIKYIAAAYLIWMGLSLAILKQQPASKPIQYSASYTNSFLIGLITTLSNPKAILFY